MGIHITYRKDFDEHGNEKMVEVSREEFPDPEPEIVEPIENLEDKAQRLIDELKMVLAELNTKNYIAQEKNNNKINNGS